MKRSSTITLIVVSLLITSLLSPLSVRPAAAAEALLLTVNTIDEGNDSSPGDGACDTGTGFGLCSLRAAIQEANAHAGLDTIQFNLPGSGVQTMTISPSPLPVISDPVILDATTQPNCNIPCIVLSGATGGGSDDGLGIYTNNSTVKGFVIISFMENGIRIFGNGNTVQANVIGFLPGDATPRPNLYGISIMGSNNTIGGTSASQRNVISGNTSYGIELGYNDIPLTSGNIIRGNFIGTNHAGTSARGNGETGIMLYQYASGTIIGSTSAGGRNVISGNGWEGIHVEGSGTLIVGNFIGTKASGKGSIGNGRDGINVYTPATNTTIGGTTSGSRNKIANNGMRGIAITNSSSASNFMRRNSIFSNAGLGIDLGANGVTPNDIMDADTGANGLQNFPTITSAGSANLVIQGNLRSQSSGTYRIEFFSSPGCDSSGFGEGKTYLGAKSVTTNGSGYVSFAFTSPIAFPAGSRITATASDGSGNTSEFSRCRTAG